MTDVVTVFLQHEGEILLLRRSEAVGTYQHQWGGVSGYVEPETDDPREDAERELREEVGAVDATLRRRGDPLRVVDDENDREWTVHPFRYDVPDRAVDPNEEVAEWEWVSPPAMLDRPCVPGLWATYRRVGPTVAAVAGDDRSGAAAISTRALAVLRDAAAEAAHADALEDPEWSSHDAVSDAARRLRDAHPEMAVVANRVNRVMATSEGLEDLAERPRTQRHHHKDDHGHGEELPVDPASGESCPHPLYGDENAEGQDRSRYRPPPSGAVGEEKDRNKSQEPGHVPVA